MTTTEKAKRSTDPTIIIEDLRLGVWKLRIGKNVEKLAESWEHIKSALPLFYRLCSDVYIAAPRLSVIFLFCQICNGLDEALLLYFSTALLREVCRG
jgi:hypothetical protein